MKFQKGNPVFEAIAVMYQRGYVELIADNFGNPVGVGIDGSSGYYIYERGQCFPASRQEVRSTILAFA